jgi:hypothetical protein
MMPIIDSNAKVENQAINRCFTRVDIFFLFKLVMTVYKKYTMPNSAKNTNQNKTMDTEFGISKNWFSKIFIRV